MLTRLHRAGLPAALVLFACQKPPDISGEIESYANLVSEANDLACECPQDLGFASELECGEALGPLGPTERQCLTNALDGHEDAAQDYLACANSAYDQYVDCLAGNVSCTAGWYDDCTDDHEQALAACPQLPADVAASVIACTP